MNNDINNAQTIMCTPDQVLQYDQTLPFECVQQNKMSYYKDNQISMIGEDNYCINGQTLAAYCMLSLRHDLLNCDNQHHTKPKPIQS